MKSAHCLFPGPVFGIADWPGKDRVILTVQNDGVSCYNTTSNAPIRSWALGKAYKGFSASAIYDVSSKHYFAAAHSSKKQTHLFSWPHSSSSSSIQQAGNQIDIKTPISTIIPIHNSSNRRKQSADASSWDVDVDVSHQPSVFIAHTNGSISLCSTTSVIDEYTYTSNLSILAASSKDTVLHTLHVNTPTSSNDNTPSFIFIASFSITPTSNNNTTSSLQCTSLYKAQLPESLQQASKHAQRPISAVFTGDHVAVLWQNGTLASYSLDQSSIPLPIPSGKEALLIENTSLLDSLPVVSPLYTRHLQGFARNSIPLGNKKNTRDEEAVNGAKIKKRTLIEANGDASGESDAALGVAGDGIALVLHQRGSMIVQAIGIDVVYGAVLVKKEYSPEDVGLRSFDHGSPLKAIYVHSSNIIASSMCGGAVLIEVDIPAPTLANLVGALRPPAPSSIAMDTLASTPISHTHGSDAAQKQGEEEKNKKKHVRTNAEIEEESSRLDILARKVYCTTEDTSIFVDGKGGTATAVQYEIDTGSTAKSHKAGAKKKGETATVPAATMDESRRDLVVKSRLIKWSIPGSKGMHDEENTAWKNLTESTSMSEDIFSENILPVFEKAQKLKSLVSFRFLCKLFMFAAEHHLWHGIHTLLSFQHPGSLADCPLLAPTLAQHSQYTTLSILLRGATDISSQDIAAVIQTILSSSSNSHTAPSHANNKSNKKSASRNSKEKKTATKNNNINMQQTQIEYAQDVCSIAENTIAIAENMLATCHHQPFEITDINVARAMCAAGCVETFTPSQICLHPLLTVCNDTSTLVDALRRLPAMYAASLLRYLLKWIRNHKNIIGDRFLPSNELPQQLFVPDAGTVIEWLNLTLDATMMKLAMRSDTKHIISDIKQEVSMYVDSLRPLVHTKGALEHLQCGAPLPMPENAVKRYSMEWLSLSVA